MKKKESLSYCLRNYTFEIRLTLLLTFKIIYLYKTCTLYFLVKKKKNQRKIFLFFLNFSYVFYIYIFMFCRKPFC